MFILRQLKLYKITKHNSIVSSVNQTPGLVPLQHSPVFFITEVKLLRMELIFARSTLARLGNASAGDGGTGAALTTFGAGGVRGVWASVVTVTEAVTAAAVDGTALGMLSVFVGAEAGTACFSFLSSTASERGGEQDQNHHSVPKELVRVQDFQWDPHHLAC